VQPGKKTHETRGVPTRSGNVVSTKDVSLKASWGSMVNRATYDGPGFKVADLAR
jgi:hypothetical protein